ELRHAVGPGVRPGRRSGLSQRGPDGWRRRLLTGWPRGLLRCLGGGLGGAERPGVVVGRRGRRVVHAGQCAEADCGLAVRTLGSGRAPPIGVSQETHKMDPDTGRMELTRPDGSALRVLVVDDEVNIAELISMALRYEGFEVSSAHTGTKA